MHRSSLTEAARRTRGGLLAALALAFALFATARLHAQAAEDVLSAKEVDTLRDAAFVPNQRLAAFTQFLNDRQKRIDDLLAHRRSHTDYGGDMHDAVDQFGQIVDELNDNLDEYARQHRDIRKAIPKLLQAAERWNTSLAALPANDSYDVVRRFALDNLKDTREIAESLQKDLPAYFQTHPEAERAEKKRASDPHAVRPE